MQVVIILSELEYQDFDKWQGFNQSHAQSISLVKDGSFYRITTTEQIFADFKAWKDLKTETLQQLNENKRLKDDLAKKKNEKTEIWYKVAVMEAVKEFAKNIGGKVWEIVKPHLDDLTWSEQVWKFIKHFFGF
jgi:predicted Holliday junction resolvase-like endonuclease